MEECIVVLVTADSEAQADAVATAVLETRLAACVNSVPGVTSRYWWEGKLERATEILLIIKTRRACLEALTAAVRAAHGYSVPEVVALSVVGGNADYLAWVVGEASAV